MPEALAATNSSRVARSARAGNRVEIGDHDRNRRTEPANPYVHGRRYADDRTLSARDQIPVRIDIVDDAEQSEGRDRSGNSRQAHDDAPDDQREQGGEHARDGCGHPHRQLRVEQPGGQSLERDRLHHGRNREPCGHIGAEAHEADVPERQQARISDKDIEADDHHDVDEHLDGSSVERAAAELIAQGSHDEQHDDQDDRGQDRLPDDRRPL